MLTIQKVDTSSKAQVNQFVDFHYRLYAKHPQWVPPFRVDIKTMLNKSKHPFFEHSDADFFVALRDGEVVGRIAAIENKPFNRCHDVKDAEFYLFDTIDDLEVSNLLFDTAFEWAHQRGLNHIVGPKGFSPFDGYGIQIEGFEHRQMMTMMNYNFPYYVPLVEAAGFTKEVDFVSCYINYKTFQIPEKIHKAAEIAKKRSSFEVMKFNNKRELVKMAREIGIAYNNTFIKNWEYYPLTEREIKFAVDNVLMVADPKLIKLIKHKDDLVGFLFAFPDVSAALQKGNGNLDPISLARILIEFKKTKWISLNGAGILPEYQGLGGNALMYSEMVKTIRDSGFEHAELTQVAETAVQMRKDLINAGGQAYKNHRVFQKHI